MNDSSMVSVFPSRIESKATLTLVGLRPSIVSLVSCAHFCKSTISVFSPLISILFIGENVPSSNDFNPATISSAVSRAKMTSIALRFAPTKA